MIGIYKITNIDNGKMYVGKGVNIKSRWNSHIKLLNSNQHFNSYLQNSWNKHGQDKFEFSVIELCKKADLCDREKFWITELRTYIGFNDCNGYNMTLGGDGVVGRILSEESKQLMFEKQPSEEIVQIDMKTGEYIDRWRSATNASRSLQIPVSGIRQCVLNDGDQYQCHGYIWILASIYDNGLFDYEQYKEKYLKYYFYPICKVDLYGNIIERWNNQEELAKIHPEDNRIIKSMLDFQRRQSNWHIYVYEKDLEKLTEDYLRDCRIKSGNYKINQFDLNHNYLRTYTQDEINTLPYKTATIKQCCSHRYSNTKNGLKKAYGFIWEFE